MSKLIALALLFGLLVGCGGVQPGGTTPPDDNVPPGATVPPEPPPAAEVEPRTGVVAEVDQSQEGRLRFLLHGDQQMSSGEPIKTWVTVDENSVVLLGEERVQYTAIEVGQQVAVTIEGPELLSYPSQAYGNKVVIQ